MSEETSNSEQREKISIEISVERMEQSEVNFNIVRNHAICFANHQRVPSSNEIPFVCAKNSEATTLVEDLKLTVEELEQEQQMSLINVELVDNELAGVFANSKKAEVGEHFVICMLLFVTEFMARDGNSSSVSCFEDEGKAFTPITCKSRFWGL
jgi:hypothetical protein